MSDLETAAPKQQRFHEILTIGLWPLWLMLLGVVLVRSFWGHSLWLDETISCWVTDGSWSDVWQRAFNFQGQSPFYFLILKAWRTVFGSGEPSLRILSAIFAISSLPLLWLIAKKFGTANFAHSVVLLFIASDAWQRSFSARPYALALFCSLLAIWAFICWQERAKLTAAVISLIATAASIYAHYLFIGTVGILILLELLRPRINANWTNRLKAQHLAIFSLLLLLSLSPLFTQIALLFARRSALANGAAQPFELVRIVFPAMQFVCVCCALTVGLIAWPGARLLPHRGPIWWLWLGWGVGGPLGFFLLSVIFDSNLISERYLLWALPGSALLLAQVVAALEPISARRMTLAFLTLLLMARESVRSWQVEDWRDVPQLVKQEIAAAKQPAVFIYSGLLEAQQPENFIQQDEQQEYLSTPAQYYPWPVTAQPLPAHLEGPGWATLRQQLTARISNADVVVIGLLQQRIGSSGKLTDRYYRELLSANGFTVKTLRPDNVFNVDDASNKQLGVVVISAQRAQ